MCTVFIADDVEALRFLVRMAVEDDPEIRVQQKLGAASRAELVRFALDDGLVEAGGA